MDVNPADNTLTRCFNLYLLRGLIDPPTCDYGWVPYNRSCYKFENAWRSWYDAKKACRDTGGHLVKIDNAHEQRFLAFNARSSYQVCVF